MGKNTFVNKHVGIYGDDSVISESPCPRFLLFCVLPYQQKAILKVEELFKPLEFIFIFIFNTIM